MSTFSYDVEYAKSHGIIRAIIVSYCSILQIDSEQIDIGKMCAATGLSKKAVCKALGVEPCEDNQDKVVVQKQFTPKVELFGNKKIISTNKPASTYYADAICKSLPSMVSDSAVLSALDKWVRVIYKSGKGITKEQVVLAVNELKELAGEDTALALEIVNTATQAGYKVFKWCMPSMNKQHQVTALTHNKEFTPRATNNINVTGEGF